MKNRWTHAYDMKPYHGKFPHRIEAVLDTGATISLGLVECWCEEIVKEAKPPSRGGEGSK
mgnify:FL=1